MRRLRLAALVVMVALAPAAARAQIPLELRFDGQAFAPTALPEFTCFSATLDRWVSCEVTKADGPGAFTLARPEPGRYRLHVSIDENTTNPRRYPGDYEAQLAFEIGDAAPERLVVDLPRLIHLTRPGDNARALEGMLTGCATQPVFDTPRWSWWSEARVEFAWEPIVPGAEYRYTVVTRPCLGPGGDREVVKAATGATAVALDLPASEEGEQYVFRVEAWKGGRLVGDLFTHDAGIHSWNYRFHVRDTTIPRWVYFAAAAGLILLLDPARRAFTGPERERHRRRARRAAMTTVLVLLAVATVAAGYFYYQDQARRRDEAARAVAEAARQRGQREFVAAFVSAAPRPDWWDAVTTPYRVESLGDLLSAWQGHPRTDEGERQFFKAAYQGIVDHPDDAQVVATAINLLHWVVRDYPHRLGLARFGFERYFLHRARTDNCANCMPGDTTHGLAQNLAQLYAADGRYDEGIAVCRKLIDERGADVSPYKLAETWNQLAWLHWQKGDRDQAVQIARDALARYGSTVRGDELRRTLERFESER